MAKAKTTQTTPKKGKAKSAANPEPPLRRSPRKTVQSAKKAEAEDAAKITKKASPAKKTSAVKKLTNALKKSTTSKKATEVAASTANTKSASSAPKKAADTKSKTATAKTKGTSPVVKTAAKAKQKSPSPKKAESTTASPRPRGRPRKSASPAATKSTPTTAPPKAKGRPRKSESPAAAKSSTASPKPRGRPPKNVPPGKVTKTKPSPRKAAAASKTREVQEDEEPSQSTDREESGGVSSLEKADVTPSTRSRSKSPTKGRTNSAPSRLQTPEKATSGSRRSSITSTGRRSRSPAKAARPTSPRQTSGAGTKARSKSSAKSRNSSTSRRGSGAGARRRARSPAKVTKATSPRKASVDRAEQMPQMFDFFGKMGEFAAAMGSPQASPTRTQVPKGVEIDSATALEYPTKTTTRTWDKDKVRKSRFPNANFEGDFEITKSNTRRTAQSPSRKIAQSSPSKATKSPTKMLSNGLTQKAARSPTRAASKSPIRKAVHSPTKASTKSPTKMAARSPTKTAHRRSSTEVRWDKKFEAGDEYSKKLHKLEMNAYKASKQGKVYRGDDPNVSEDDNARAKQQGVARAKAEYAMRHLSDGREQRVRDGYNDQVVDLGNGDDDGIGRQGSRSRSKSPTKQTKPASPRRKPSASSPQPPPPSPSRGRSASRQQSPRLNLSNQTDDETFTPLPAGQPSAPERGTVHSITNPELIAGTNEKNPFFETMPGPEYWHRNQPSYFMFGETPYMQQEISRQINDDLRRGNGAKEAEKPRSNSVFGIFSPPKLFSSAFGKATEQSVPIEKALKRSPFALPDIDDEKVEAAMRELMRNRTGPGSLKNCKTSGDSSPGKGRKTARRVSGGNGSRSRSPEYRMSGAL